MLRKLIPLLILCAVAVGLTGCGGSDNKAIPPDKQYTPPPANAEQEGNVKGKASKNNAADEK